LAEPVRQHIGLVVACFIVIGPFGVQLFTVIGRLREQLFTEIGRTLGGALLRLVA